MDSTAVSILRNQVQSALETVEEIVGEEQEKYDNMPDSLRNGSKGDDLQEVMDALANSVNHLRWVIDELDDFKSTKDNSGLAEEIQSSIDQAQEDAMSV
jgi:prefoldin subunit 5